nr:chorismate-binding protein [Thermoleophilaceae bacterium]
MRTRLEPGLRALTVALEESVDPSAVALAARAPGERCFCFEQPDREGWALATLGAAAAVEASGPGRFEHAAREGRALLGSVEGEGALLVGGFAFAPDGGRSPHWGGFAPAQLVLPQIAIRRHRRRVWATFVGPDPEALRVRLEAVLGAAMPLIDPDPVARPRVASAAPPEHYEEAVARAVERIRAGSIEKLVLAREVRVHAPRAIDPAPVFGALRELF